MQNSRKLLHASVSRSTECRKLKIITGLNTLSSKLPIEPAIDGRAVVAEHLHADHRQRLGLRRVHLARHDRRAGLVLREDQLAEPGPRPGAEPADVVGDLHEAHRERLHRAAGEHEVVVRRRARRTCSRAEVNGSPVISAIFAAARSANSGCVLRPVPTAVPPIASS